VLLREIAAALAKAASRGGAAMTKITTEHLARRACVYIRQSTADQLAQQSVRCRACRARRPVAAIG